EACLHLGRQQVGGESGLGPRDPGDRAASPRRHGLRDRVDRLRNGRGRFLDEATEIKQTPLLPEDSIPELSAEPPVTKRGDLWLLGAHRLYCGDARDERAYDALMKRTKADFVFSDPPYNVPIDGHVSGLGRIRHRDFAMASGEMSQAEYTTF